MHSVRMKWSTPQMLVQTSGVKTEVVEARGGGVRRLEQLTTKAVGLKEQGGLLLLKMWIFKIKWRLTQARRKWLFGQADKLPTHKLMFLTVLE